MNTTILYYDSCEANQNKIIQIIYTVFRRYRSIHTQDRSMLQNFYRSIKFCNINAGNCDDTPRLAPFHSGSKSIDVSELWSQKSFAHYFLFLQVVSVPKIRKIPYFVHQVFKNHELVNYNSGASDWHTNDPTWDMLSWLFD